MNKNICLLFVILLSCAHPSIVVDRSHSKKPDWLKNLPEETSEYIFEVGVRTFAPTLEGGETDARINGFRKLLETYFGMKGKHIYQRVKKTMETQYTDTLRVESSGEIWGIRQIDSYWEKEKSEGEVVRYTYNVWVLLRGRKKELEDAVMKAKERIEKKIALARSLYYESEILIRDYNIGSALSRLSSVCGLLQDIKDEPAAVEVDQKSRLRIKRLLSLLNIMKLTDEHELKGIVGKEVEIPLEVQVLYKGKKIPGIPLEFIFIKSSGIINTPVYSDKDGIALTKVLRVDLETDANIIEVSISLKELSLTETFKAPRVYFSFPSYKEKKGVLVCIKEPESIIEPAIVAKIEGDISVRPKDLTDDEVESILKENMEEMEEIAKRIDVSIFIIGKTTTFFSSELENMLCYRAMVDIKAIDIEKKEVIYSKTIEGKGFGLSENQAIVNALKDIGKKISKEFTLYIH